MSIIVSQQAVVSPTERANQAMANAFASKRLQYLLIATITIKILLMILFSSDYENKLFVPFVHHYLQNIGSNPWDYFYAHSTARDQFPYQPLMLYILSFFSAPLMVLGWDNPLIRNFFFKLPTLLADLSVGYFLLRMFPQKWRHVFWFYFLSPIIIYACYMHSQLDLIPTALLFATFYFLRRNKLLIAFILYGMALCTKLHVVVAFPIIAIYLFRNGKPREVLNFAIISVSVYLLVVVPYFNSPGFQHMVLSNPKQSRILEVFATIGDLKLYLPIMAIFLAIGRFALYPKINTDLLDAFLALIFSVMVLLIVPGPAWYVWSIPFLSVFLIKHFRKNRNLMAPFVWLNFFYLVYFIFFDRPDHVDLIFIDQPVQFKIYIDTLRDFVFTLLEVGLLGNIILCYRAGVKSNSIYKRDRGLVIGIGGDSGSGKSTLLGDLKSILSGRVVELEGDADHKWERGDVHWQDFTHLDPKANFLHRQADTILSLKRGRMVKRSDYDHATGHFTEPQTIEPNDFIIISGLHTFYLPKMRSLIDLKIFMDTDAPLHEKWKLLRDQKDRGYTEEEVARQTAKRRPDIDRFIAPQKDFADLVVHYFLQADVDTKSGAGEAESALSSVAESALSSVAESALSGAAEGALSSAAESVLSSAVEGQGTEADETPRTNSGGAVHTAEADGSSAELIPTPALCLKVALSSSISLEALVDALRNANIPVFWDYSENLSRQEITLYRAVSAALLNNLANDLIANPLDLLGNEIVCLDGYRGFVQLIVLLALSELMQEREESNAS